MCVDEPQWLRSYSLSCVRRTLFDYFAASFELIGICVTFGVFVCVLLMFRCRWRYNRMKIIQWRETLAFACRYNKHLSHKRTRALTWMPSFYTSSKLSMKLLSTWFDVASALSSWSDPYYLVSLVLPFNPDRSTSVATIYRIEPSQYDKETRRTKRKA